MSIYIDDDNYFSVVRASEDAGFLAGALPRQTRIGELEGSLVFAEHIPLIPESEWKDRIRYMTENKLFIGQRFQPDPKTHYQNGDPTCWAYSLGQALEGTMVGMGQEHRLLAPESILGVCNYRKQGYYLDRALEWTAKHGMAQRSFVPPYTDDPRRWTPGWDEDAKNQIPLEYFDLGGVNVWSETVTGLLSGFGCYVGYDWWRHAVWLDMLGIDDRGRIMVHTPNTHGPGNDAWIKGSKAVPSMGSFILRQVCFRSLAA